MSQDEAAKGLSATEEGVGSGVESLFCALKNWLYKNLNKKTLTFINSNALRRIHFDHSKALFISEKWVNITNE